MLSRSARKLETALLSCSRQSLPRPARLYSTPTKRVNAPAHATASAPSPDAFPPYMSPEGNSWQHQMEDFLRRQTPYTILPTPSPAAKQKELQAMLITDSATQDLISIVGACLHNLYDVPRAKQVFDDLRES
ncbi:hypothetical protein FOMPIDRAFT_54268, partial [Fomitopsis schrenkii]